ncbi:RcnB family protein [Mesorhizobium sp. NPDC059025]|uniref:RcnB family protein n=1 Tax=unclassified Mesorhizobium TaxID=325217 RepID=UPI00368A2589
MKRLILSGMAISMLAVSSLPGFAAPIAVPGVPDSNLISAQYREPVRKDRRVVDERVIVKKKVVTKQVVVKKRWKNGQRYDSWRSAKGMKDYSRYGLRRPGPGQHWVRAGNDYLLVGIATGVIASVIAAR